MKNSTFSLLSTNSRVGLTPDSVAIEAKVINEFFIDELPKRLTRANSFMVLDEVFIIRKRDYKGKPSKIFHIFRKSDGRLICSIPREKDDAIELFMRKWIDWENQNNRRI